VDYTDFMKPRGPSQMTTNQAPVGGASGSGGLDKVGRNDLCPCGSGKKFKKCHGA
jgi:preprotein translocase subunit SecA